MREVKKVTLSALMVALAVALCTLGAYLETLDLSVAAVASLTVVFVYLEIGAPYTYFCWLATSLLTFIFFPHSMVWLEFLLVFGVYPLLKALVEKLPRFLWIPVKAVLFSAMLFALYALISFVFGFSYFGERAEEYVSFGWLLYAVALVAAFAYDLLLSMLVRIYVFKWRGKIKKYLK